MTQRTPRQAQHRTQPYYTAEHLLSYRISHHARFFFPLVSLSSASSSSTLSKRFADHLGFLLIDVAFRDATNRNEKSTKLTSARVKK